MTNIVRRRVLRGMLNGAAVTVALPLLDCFLNGNGTALADGKPMPIRFGSWFWGLGVQSKVFTPKKTGVGYDLPEEAQAFAPIQGDMNLLTNMTVYKDKAPNICHFTGWIIMRAGAPCANIDDRPGETFDITIANQIGRASRFSQLSATSTGDARQSVSYESMNAPTIPDASPLSLYTRIFGPDFQDPNGADFRPDPHVMARKSVLSGVIDDAQKLKSKLGAFDKARLDEYFTGLRHLEHQLDRQLTKPEPIAACHAGDKPGAVTVSADTESISKRHRLLADMMAMAVACDQTRVFNMFYSGAQANTIKIGYEKPHHTTTHEERIDDVQGIQVTCSWFTRRAMEEWAYYVQAFKNIKEGDGTLLDNVLIVGTTDHGYARIHSLDGMPAFTAGRCGGKVKTGLHIATEGRQGTMIGLTAMRLMGIEKASWGVGSNATTKEFSEIYV